MNDLVYETCKYIYKNPNKSYFAYIKEMSDRSIWRYTNVVSLVADLVAMGVLNCIKRVSEYGEYNTLQVNTKGYLAYYGNSFDNAICMTIIDTILKNRRKAKMSIVNKIKAIYCSLRDTEILELLGLLESRGIIRYSVECYDSCTYSSPYIDLYALKGAYSY